MEKEKNKGIIVLIIVLIIIILGLGGYIVYDKVLKVEEPKDIEQKEEVVEKTDFYDVSELVKNNYIEKIETTEMDFIKILDGKVEVKSTDESESFVKAKGIEGTPKFVYARSLCSDCQLEWGYVVLTEEGNVYYAEWKHEISGVSEFEKINVDVIKDIYKLSDVKGIYDGFAFYETEEGDLISVIDEHKTFKEIWAYPDLSFKIHTGYSILYLISPDKKVFFKDKSEVLYNGESIYAKDIFYKDNVDLSGQETYIIGQNNKVYLIETPTGNFEKDSVKVDLYNQKEVKDYKIVNMNNENNEYKVEITYTDGTTETFEKTYVSTLYFRTK